MFIKKLTEAEFIAQFKKAGRGQHFSPQGFKGMFKYFSMMERESGMQIELDVIAICCGYHEVQKCYKNHLEEYRDCDICFRTAKTIVFFV